jgi:hypothetical protein
LSNESGFFTAFALVKEWLQKLKLGLLGFGTKTSATMESFSHD